MKSMIKKLCNIQKDFSMALAIKKRCAFYGAPSLFAKKAIPLKIISEGEFSFINIIKNPQVIHRSKKITYSTPKSIHFVALLSTENKVYMAVSLVEQHKEKDLWRPLHQ